MPDLCSIGEYSVFADQLKADLKAFKKESKSGWLAKATRAVDGLASDELRRLVALETRRHYGAFFTPSELASKVVKELFPKLDHNVVIYDAASGAGNLLLASMDYIEENKVTPTNKHFLLGTDIHEEFVSTAKSRLSIKQLILQNGEQSIYDQPRFQVEQMDGLTGNGFYKMASHVFVNPPFNMVPTPEDITWSKGKVSAAALFIHRIIESITPGTTITAILPEVLRGGSRYHSWRGMVLDNCINERIKLLGQFDQHADVDVFGILLRKREAPIKRNKSTNKLVPERRAEITIDQEFAVCVGPVVDNRDDHEGKRRGYVISRGLPGWSIQKKYKQTRNHKGKAFKGPFIVIKRTSRMGDSQRAIASIINTPKPVYVDNHLIILRPKTRTLKACKAMLENLKDPRTDKWLNDEIRCRHLTVKIVSKIPIWQ